VMTIPHDRSCNLVMRPQVITTVDLRSRDRRGIWAACWMLRYWALFRRSVRSRNFIRVLFVLAEFTMIIGRNVLVLFQTRARRRLR